MPGLDGASVLRRLVAEPAQAVIVLSCLTATATKVRCLEAGAEDYLAKPFSLDELLARVRARLRVATGRATSLVAGRLRLDLIRREADSGAGPVPLAEREFLLLRELMQRPVRPSPSSGCCRRSGAITSTRAPTWSTSTCAGSGPSWAPTRSRPCEVRGIESSSRDRRHQLLASGWLDVAWVVFAVANLVAMALVPEWETVPFHFIWVSLTIVYGYRVWGPP